MDGAVTRGELEAQRIATEEALALPLGDGDEQALVRNKAPQADLIEPGRALALADFAPQHREAQEGVEQAGHQASQHRRDEPGRDNHDNT